MVSTIADRIRKRRSDAGWSQAELAERLGWHPSWVSQIETGAREPNARNLALLAGALGCRTDDLLPPEKPVKRKVQP